MRVAISSRAKVRRLFIINLISTREWFAILRYCFLGGAPSSWRSTPDRLPGGQPKSQSLCSLDYQQANASAELVQHREKPWWYQPLASIESQIHLILSRVNRECRRPQPVARALELDGRPIGKVTADLHQLCTRCIDSEGHPASVTSLRRKARYSWRSFHNACLYLCLLRLYRGSLSDTSRSQANAR